MNTNNLSALRTHITPFYGDHLPEQLRYRDRAGREVLIPTHTATLDELAFAIQMAAEEQSLASRRRNALDELYINARKSGARALERSRTCRPPALPEHRVFSKRDPLAA